MAPKLTITEKCGRCGKRAATLQGESIIDYHDCTNPPPGPGAFAQRWTASAVNFIRGEWTAEELAIELDEANARISVLQTERLEYYSALRGVMDALPSELRPLS